MQNLPVATHLLDGSAELRVRALTESAEAAFLAIPPYVVHCEIEDFPAGPMGGHPTCCGPRTRYGVTPPHPAPTSPEGWELHRKMLNAIERFDKRHSPYCRACVRGGITSSCLLGVVYGEAMWAFAWAVDESNKEAAAIEADATRPGRLVRYHGSVADAHGLYTLRGLCCCWERPRDGRISCDDDWRAPIRYELFNEGRQLLECVGRASFSPA